MFFDSIVLIKNRLKNKITLGYRRFRLTIITNKCQTLVRELKFVGQL